MVGHGEETQTWEQVQALKKIHPTGTKYDEKKVALKGYLNTHKSYLKGGYIQTRQTGASLLGQLTPVRRQYTKKKSAAEAVVNIEPVKSTPRNVGSKGGVEGKGIVRPETTSKHVKTRRGGWFCNGEKKKLPQVGRKHRSESGRAENPQRYKGGENLHGAKCTRRAAMGKSGIEEDRI